MPSINFNQSAVVALSTLRTINMNLEKVQNVISTGKEISNSKDNAAVWSISKVMESDVSGFMAIQDSLNLGASTVGVARGAAEQVTELLQEMKSLIVAAQEDNVDRSKIQDDVTALRTQIVDIVDAAQFNGLNLLKGSTANPIQVLGSLDRTDATSVSAKFIDVVKQNLEVEGGTFGSTVALATQGAFAGGSATLADGAAVTLTFTGTDVVTAGDSYRISYNGKDFEYIARTGDTANDIINSLYDDLTTELAVTGEPLSVVRTLSDDVSVDDAVLTITNNDGGGGTFSVTTADFSGGTAGGGLGDLDGLSVLTGTDATTALGTIETLISTAVSASASFGSAQNRIEIQNNFVQSLVDSMDAGISALTDANLEEASARLQSLQVQQQLNIQALTIANQSPQAILALFR